MGDSGICQQPLQIPLGQGRQRAQRHGGDSQGQQDRAEKFAHGLEGKRAEAKPPD